MIEKTSLKRIGLNIVVVSFLVLLSLYFSVGSGTKYMKVFLNIERDIPIYSVETNEKKVALTFDAAWGEEYTDEILKILEKNNVKATFFLVGNWVDRYPEKVKKIYEKGHEIGNHSTSHPHFTELNNEKIKEEIFLTSEKVKSINNKGTTLFRPPFGDYNSEVVKTVKETGHYCILWDVDSLDWKNPGEDVILNRVIEKADNGSIVLFHNNAEETPKVLDRIIKELKKRNFTFVKISDLIYKDNYYIDNLGRQKQIK